MNRKNFVQNIEKLIDPVTTGSLHFFQSIGGSLPKNIQKKMVNKSAKESPYMGFVVEPYCFFLNYEIKDKKYFESLLPNNFKLKKTKIFKEDEEEKYYFILGCFSARTSAFFGNRVEAYVVCENINTGLTSWVIIDYDTNTISYDSKNGLSNSTVKEGVITTDFSGDVVVNMQRKDDTNKIIFKSNVKNGQYKKLAYDLWTEGNLSVGYGKSFSNDGDVFSLQFDPNEMDEALEINLNNINIEANTWYSDYLEDEPAKLACFPFAQHYLCNSPGYYKKLKNEEELLESIQQIEFEKIKVYSIDGLKKKMIIGNIISLSLTIIIILLLIIY